MRPGILPQAFCDTGREGVRCTEDIRVQLFPGEKGFGPPVFEEPVESGYVVFPRSLFLFVPDEYFFSRGQEGDVEVPDAADFIQKKGKILFFTIKRNQRQIRLIL